MPPKKADPKKAPGSVGRPTEASGLYIPCHLPPWDDADIEREDWGDLNLVVTPNTPLFVDGGTSEGSATAPAPTATMIANHVKEWKRPSAIFSPFKPIVVRGPQLSTGTGTGQEDAATAAEKPGSARLMREFKGEGGNATAKSARPDRTKNVTPAYMRAFNSALMVLQQYEALLPKGTYAWEAIYPQVNGIPVVNPYGKYAIKLFWNGAFFKVVIDDRFPTDVFGQSIYTVTTAKEIWPALLAKAILKALGPAHESVLFTNPMLTLSCLLCGWVPQWLSPSADEVQLLNVFQKRETDPNNILICGLTPAVDGAPATVCAITSVQRAGTVCTLNVLSPQQQSLPADVTVLSQHPLHPSWNSLQLPWSAMASMFASIIVLRPTMPTTAMPKSIYVDNRQIYQAPNSEETVPGPPSSQTSHTKWMIIKSTQETELLLVYSVAYTSTERGSAAQRKSSSFHASQKEEAGPRRSESSVTPSKCCISVQEYNWKHRPHYRTVSRLESPVDTTNSAYLFLPKGTHALRMDIEGLSSSKAAFTVLTSTENVIWGEEKEILAGALSLNRCSDAGSYAFHEAGSLTMWFKRIIFVKGSHAECCFSLQTLPKGTDLEQYKVPLTVTDPKGKGAAAEAKPKPGGKQSVAPVAQAPAVEEISIPEPAVDIMAHTELVLVDLDTNKTIRSTDGKIMNAILPGNKCGHMIMAYATPPVMYPKGLWTLSLTAEGQFDRMESRTFDDVITKSGEYKVNGAGGIFKYFVTAAEATTASVVIDLYESFQATFTVHVLHNDKIIATRADQKRSCLLEHLPFTAAEKGSTSVYAIHCTLDTTTAAVLRHQRSERAKDVFRTTPGGPIGSIDVRYTMKILASSAKLEVKEDMAAVESAALVKASWSRLKDTPVEVHVKPNKANPKDKSGAAVDDGGRMAKAKESRAKYLASLALPPEKAVSDPQVESFSVTMATALSAPKSLAAELQSKIDAYNDGLSRDFKNNVAAIKATTEEQLLALQKSAEVSASSWAARRREVHGTEDSDAKASKAKQKK